MKKNINFWKNKNILITGGAGFIGSNLANNLVKISKSISVLDNLERGNSNNLHQGIKFIKIDLRTKSKKLIHYIQSSDIVIHLASKVGGISFYENNAYDILKENILIDSNVLDCVVNSGVKFYFYASSSHIYPLKYQKQYKVKTLKENDSDSSHPTLSYGWAKLIGEKNIEFASSLNKDINYSIGRLVGIYGPNQDTDLSNGSLIPVLCKRAINYPNFNFEIKTNGKEIRSYCHINDAITLIKKLIESSNSKKKDFIYNICSDEYYSIDQIAKKIIKISKKNIKLKKTHIEGSIKSQFCSNKKIINKVNWSPKIKLDEGLESVYFDIKSKNI